VIRSYLRHIDRPDCCSPSIRPGCLRPMARASVARLQCKRTRYFWGCAGFGGWLTTNLVLGVTARPDHNWRRVSSRTVWPIDCADRRLGLRLVRVWMWLSAYRGSEPTGSGAWPVDGR
jgi:hypothetical protein